MMCSILGSNPLLRKCCFNEPGPEEFTLIPPGGDYYEIRSTEVVLQNSVLPPQHSDEDRVQTLEEKIKQLEEKLDLTHKMQQEHASPIVLRAEPQLEEKLDLSHKMQQEHASPIVLRGEPIRSEMPLRMPPIKEGLEPNFPTKIESINEKLKEHQARPLSSYQAVTRVQTMSSYQAVTPTPQKDPIEDMNQDVRGRSGPTVPVPENGACPRELSRGSEGSDPGRDHFPRGDYLLGEAADMEKMNGYDLMNMEQMVSKIAGSPLGCINFGNTFLWRQQNNEIRSLRGHSLEGMAFGEACAKYQSVTMLALKKADGRVMWAPAPHIRLHSSDEILLIECAPFVMAKGLAVSAMPQQPSFRGVETQDSFRPRRCCS